MDRIGKNMTFLLSLALARCVVECNAQGHSHVHNHRHNHGHNHDHIRGQCGVTEYANSAGYISSPGFPNSYENEIHCHYHLRSSGQTSLNISFLTIDLEVIDGCAYDYVEIWCAGIYENIHKICRLGEIRSVYYASCNHCEIKFHTDEQSTGTGFKFYYNFQRVGSATSASTTTGRFNTKSKTIAFKPATEASTVSIIATEVTHLSDILSGNANDGSINQYALLILVVCVVLGISLLFVLTLLIILKCRANQSRVVDGGQPQTIIKLSNISPGERHADPYEFERERTRYEQIHQNQSYGSHYEDLV